ncbi:MAG: GDP-mannose 4,6-dehydratase [Ignavibacteria bacterium]|jgi:nucleoside-diphosphate-sugar epimerase
MKCLVTGGAGFIGSNIFEELLKRNYSVGVLDNSSIGKTENLRESEKDKAVDKIDVIHQQAVLLSVPVL